MVESDNKEVVTALREIVAGKVEWEESKERPRKRRREKVGHRTRGTGFD